MNFASVSVVIPCYCCSETIKRAVDSVLEQTLLPKEIILVDDFSNDCGATLKALSDIRETNSKIPINIIQLNKNDGPGTARNVGWANASQPYIAFLDADDCWHSKKIEIQYGWMISNPEAVLSFHRSLQIFSGENPVLDLARFSIRNVGFKSLLLKNLVPTRSVMLKTSVSQRFYPGKRHAEDYLLWLKIAYANKGLWFIDAVLSYSYKNDFGEAGLNSLLYKSYLGVLDAYQKILHDHIISYPTYYFLVIYASIKHIRRVFLVYLRGGVHR